MKYIIIEEDLREKDKHWDSQATPLTYRVSIELDENLIILKREYFYVGYNDGELINGFYFDNEVGWSNSPTINRATFLTRNFDLNFLKQKEDELIKKFYKRLIKSEINLKNKLKSTVEKLNEEIKEYQEYQKNELFVKLIRKNKLKKIGIQAAII